MILARLILDLQAGLLLGTLLQRALHLTQFIVPRAHSRLHLGDSFLQRVYVTFLARNRLPKALNLRVDFEQPVLVFISINIH